MNYVDYKTSDGNFSVDWDTVFHIVRGHFLYQMARDEKKIETVEGARFGDADIKQISIPWKSIRPKALTLTNTILGDIIQRNDIGGLHKLIHNNFFPMMTRNKQVVRDEMSRIQTENAHTVNDLVDKWGDVITGTKIIRDTSFTAVSIGATIVGGPAGLALAGAASGGKGLSKYQDTHNVGSAIIEGTASLITTIIPLGAAASGVKTSATLDGTLVMVDAMFDTAQNMVEGDSFMRATLKAGGKQAIGTTLGKLIPVDAKAVEKIMNNSAIPVKSVFVTAEALQKIKLENVGAKQVARIGAEALADTVAKRATDEISDRVQPQPHRMAQHFTNIARSNEEKDLLGTLNCQLTIAERAIKKIS